MVDQAELFNMTKKDEIAMLKRSLLSARNALKKVLLLLPCNLPCEKLKTTQNTIKYAIETFDEISDVCRKYKEY